MEQPQTPQNTPNKRSEKIGMIHFAKDMASAFLMALVAIFYVIQAFRIPTGSMEDSLLVGDFLLGLKFIYGAPVLPFTYARLPAVQNPAPGDVIIFKYPGADNKDYIKRCVAGPHQTVRCEGTQLFVNDSLFVDPPHGKHIRNGQLDSRVTTFEKLTVPGKGDTLNADSMKIRDFLFLKHLVHQENPRSKIEVRFQLYIDSVFSNNEKIIPYGYQSISFNDIDFNKIDNWVFLDDIFDQVASKFSDKKVTIDKILLVDNKQVSKYAVKYDNYFMMGDNRDNSTDSRYWGYLNRNFIKAKAFILYFSLDKEVPVWQLPLKIRWNRIGKLIKSWDGLHPDIDGKK